MKIENQDFFSEVIDNYNQLKYTLLEVQTFNPEHYGFPELCYKMMETDKKRVAVFKRAFDHYGSLKDKVVCEAGVGRLALSQYYLPHVKKAYLIENNPNIIPFVKEELYKKGWSKKTEFITGDALKVTLPESVDFLIGELMSIYCANEMQVQIFQHLRQFLKPEGKMMPEKIINLLQPVKADFEKGHKHYPLLGTRYWPELLGTQELANVTDLKNASSERVHFETHSMAWLSGEVNAVLMHSLIQVAEGINFSGTDSLMPPTVLKLEKPMKVKAGETYQLKGSYNYGTSLEEAKFEITE